MKTIYLSIIVSIYSFDLMAVPLENRLWKLEKLQCQQNAVHFRSFDLEKKLLSLFLNHALEVHSRFVRLRVMEFVPWGAYLPQDHDRSEQSFPLEEIFFEETPLGQRSDLWGQTLLRGLKIRFVAQSMRVTFLGISCHSIDARYSEQNDLEAIYQKIHPIEHKDSLETVFNDASCLETMRRIVEQMRSKKRDILLLKPQLDSIYLSLASFFPAYEAPSRVEQAILFYLKLFRQKIQQVEQTKSYLMVNQNLGYSDVYALLRERVTLFQWVVEFFAIQSFIGSVFHEVFFTQAQLRNMVEQAKLVRYDLLSLTVIEEDLKSDFAFFRENGVTADLQDLAQNLLQSFFLLESIRLVTRMLRYSHIVLATALSESQLMNSCYAAMKEKYQFAKNKLLFDTSKLLTYLDVHPSTSVEASVAQRIYNLLSSESLNSMDCCMDRFYHFISVWRECVRDAVVCLQSRPVVFLSREDFVFVEAVPSPQEFCLWVDQFCRNVCQQIQ